MYFPSAEEEARQRDLEILVKELLAIGVRREATIRQMQHLMLDYPPEEVIALLTTHVLNAYEAYEKRFSNHDKQ